VDETAKKKGLAALVIAMKPSKGSDDKKSGDDGFAVAAGEAFKAVKGDDKAAFVKALGNALKLHCADDDDGGEESEE
jgi:hypothetical protein